MPNSSIVPLSVDVADYSIVAPEQFIQATRDSGYKDVCSAVSELVDNAIQARATRIDIRIEITSPGRCSLSVLDNGIGMDPATLRSALRFGGSSRFDDRRGLGRFGMGLPNSSFSQAKRVSVFTWQRESPNVWSSYLDYREILAGQMREVPVPLSSKSLPIQVASASGTLVVWEECDRIPYKRTSTVVKRLTRALGQRFRRYILKGVTISANSHRITAFDPLFLEPACEYSGAEPYGNTLVYEVNAQPDRPSSDIGCVRVRFSELPVEKWRYLSNLEKRKMGLANGAGVSVLRADREVDFGWYFMPKKRRENYDDWWRCEIRFDPILDEIFGITHTKQQIRPSPHLMAILAPDIETTARQLNTRARARHRSMQAATSRSITAAKAEKAENLLPPLPKRKRSSIVSGRPNRPYSYSIALSRLNNTGFMDLEQSRDGLSLTLNEDHPLTKAIYQNISADGQRLFELVLFALARSEAAASPATSQSLREFRNRWADYIATYLKA